MLLVDCGGFLILYSLHTKVASRFLLLDSLFSSLPFLPTNLLEISEVCYSGKVEI